MATNATAISSFGKHDGDAIPPAESLEFSSARTCRPGAATGRRLRGLRLEREMATALGFVGLLKQKVVKATWQVSACSPTLVFSRSEYSCCCMSITLLTSYKGRSGSPETWPFPPSHRPAAGTTRRRYPRARSGSDALLRVPSEAPTAVGRLVYGLRCTGRSPPPTWSTAAAR